ncbi:hypothetical protein [Bacillus sp. JJ1764]|uniref:hypothetical protein n=1 Tax=Bacillus sp. JJ1764 TaxID=3122964 RepID=UPI002FFE203C
MNELQAEFSPEEQLEYFLLLDFLKKEEKKIISKRIKMGIAAKKFKGGKKKIQQINNCTLSS